MERVAKGRKKEERWTKAEREGKKASMRWSRGATGIPGPRTGRFSGPHSSSFLVPIRRRVPPLSFFPPLCFRVSVESCSFPALPSSFVLSLSRGS